METFGTLTHAINILTVSCRYHHSHVYMYNHKEDLKPQGRYTLQCEPSRSKDQTPLWEHAGPDEDCSVNARDHANPRALVPCPCHFLTNTDRRREFEKLGLQTINENFSCLRSPLSFKVDPHPPVLKCDRNLGSAFLPHIGENKFLIPLVFPSMNKAFNSGFTSLWPKETEREHAYSRVGECN